MARNRKRRRDDSASPDDQDIAAPESLPSELEGATPDADMAAAQMALGRPELSERPSPEQLDDYVEAQPKSADDESAQDEHAVATTGRKQSLPARAVGFLRGSWSELHRVQWPDRQQVFQATGVVLGFVIVAGAFLAVADLAASKLVHLILK